TGKAIVPIETRDDGSFEALFIGETRSGKTAAELEELMDAIRFNGMYPWLAAAAETARLREDDAARAALLEKTMVEELCRWTALADERMAAHGIDVFGMPGYDKPWSCDAVSASAAHVRTWAD